MPAAYVSDLEADHGHGVGNNLIPEREEVARMQRLPFMNKPAERKRRATTPKQSLLNGRKPAKGSFADLFTRPGQKYFPFSPREHGTPTPYTPVIISRLSIMLIPQYTVGQTLGR